ncbi:MAG: outer membrane homotrimeric porin, partial [Mailhella sp.]
GFEGKNYQNAGQRVRLGLSFVQSENLSGYFQAQIGIDEWGVHNNIDANGDKHGNGISARQAYVDWVIPQTDITVRMGRSVFGLPADAIGGKNAVMASWVPQDGVVINAPVTDWLNINAFWARIDTPATAAGAAANTDVVTGQRSDAFALAANMKFDGFSVSPYLLYATLDKDTTRRTETATGDSDEGMGLANANAYWLGASAVFSAFDPFTFKLSAAYGAKSYEGSEHGTADVDLGDRKGWYVQGQASYATAYGTPMFSAWYASGDDAKDYGRQGWIPTLGGRFLPTNSFTDGGASLFNGVANSFIGGTWGVQLGWTKVSFLENLSHDLKVTLFQGTNNSANDYAAAHAPQEYMTTKDRAYEFNFNSTYQIYKNLSTTLELAYIINDFDNNASTFRKSYSEDDWNASLYFCYKF